jgi:cytochrome c peroxidase
LSTVLQSCLPPEVSVTKPKRVSLTTPKERLVSVKLSNVGWKGMTMDKRTRKSRREFPVKVHIDLMKCLTVAAVMAPLHFATAQSVDPDQAWAPPAIAHAQQMRKFKDRSTSVQTALPVIPQFKLDTDPTGQVATFQPGGSTTTSSNAFFQNLGTNGRTCFTCHQPQTGWTISAASAKSLFGQSAGNAPLFRLVDGATCPNDDVSTLANRQIAYSLLLSKGLIRIGLALPQNAEFTISIVSDPYNCNTNPPTPGIFSFYRRPLLSTNLGFLSTIMWDGRETTHGLFVQATDATKIHAQGGESGPTPDQLNQIVAFELGVFTAQQVDKQVGQLASNGATGGPVALSQQLPNFVPGINDPFIGGPFTSNIFDLYTAFGSSGSPHRQSVARGELLFNTTNISITDVAGINGAGDALEGKPFAGFCGTCHDTPDVGNHSVSAPLNIGVANAGGANSLTPSPPVLDITGLPVFQLNCVMGPLMGSTFTVTDPGRAFISGKCADIGKVKGPTLRGLAARAPYFHNGSAATLLDVVNFYHQRFNIGFSDQDKQDLVNFLNSL